MSKLIFEIREELKRHIDKKYKAGAVNFFKEPIKCYGVRTPIVRRIAKAYFPKHATKPQIFRYCEELLKSDHNEEATIAFAWTLNKKREFKVSDFKLFEGWLKKYINNWSKCDDFCTHTLGYMVETYPNLIRQVKIWTNSSNRWLRRASAVTFIISARRGLFFKDIFCITDRLMLDKDDLVQKGYGWLLKTAAEFDQKLVFNYVMKHKVKMPRTALRYAIEKMPDKLKNRLIYFS